VILEVEGSGKPDLSGGPYLSTFYPKFQMQDVSTPYTMEIDGTISYNSAP